MGREPGNALVKPQLSHIERDDGNTWVIEYDVLLGMHKRDHAAVVVIVCNGHGQQLRRSDGSVLVV